MGVVVEDDQVTFAPLAENTGLNGFHFFHSCYCIQGAMKNEQGNTNTLSLFQR